MKYLIAFSGGLDSSVLLHLFSSPQSYFEVRAIHIHHGLNKKADEWVQHCQNICDEKNIPLEIFYIQLADKKGQSIEALARDMRYKIFADALLPNEILLTAHHQNDQAETILLHALKGAGPEGLAAMPIVKKFSRGYHWRPLLSKTRNEILAYAKKNNLSWIEDSSNKDSRFDRNFLRNMIIPNLEKRWPNIVNNLARVAHIQAEVSQHFDKILAPHWEKIPLAIENLKLHPIYKTETILPFSLLDSLPLNLKSWMVRSWIKKNSKIIISQKTLSIIQKEIIGAKTDTQPQLKIGSFLLRRYANALWLTHSEKFFCYKTILEKHLLKLSQQLNLSKNDFCIKTREGGEILLTPQHKRKLKKVLQEKNIPPWERKNIPLIFHNDNLIAVAL